MLGRPIILALSAAIAAASMAIGAAPALAEDSVKFSDHYEGYHLRPPYYIKGVGWHYPPRHRISRDYYFGYHHHGTRGPKIYVEPKVYVQKVRYVPRRSPHAEWCHARYKSYRASDNTFQPAKGPRRQCCPPHR